MLVDAEKIQELVDLRVRAKKRFVMANKAFKSASKYINNHPCRRKGMRGRKKLKLCFSAVCNLGQIRTQSRTRDIMNKRVTRFNGCSEKLEANSTYCNNRLPEKIQMYDKSLCGKVSEAAKSFTCQLLEQLDTAESHQLQED